MHPVPRKFIPTMARRALPAVLAASMAAAGAAYAQEQNVAYHVMAEALGLDRDRR